MRNFPAHNVNCCPVRLFLKYVGLLPTGNSCGKLYLRPKMRHTPNIMYCDQPYAK